MLGHRPCDFRASVIRRPTMVRTDNFADIEFAAKLLGCIDSIQVAGCTQRSSESVSHAQKNKQKQNKENIQTTQYIYMGLSEKPS